MGSRATTPGQRGTAVQRSAAQHTAQRSAAQRSSPRVPPLLEVAVGEADGDGASAGFLHRHLAVGEGSEGGGSQRQRLVGAELPVIAGQQGVSGSAAFPTAGWRRLNKWQWQHKLRQQAKGH